MTTLHRIDKFIVPPTSLDEFLRQVRLTHELLSHQRGIGTNDVVTLVGGDSPFNVVTHVSWDSAEHLQAASAVVGEHMSQSGFDRVEFMRRLGVTGDFATYA